MSKQSHDPKCAFGKRFAEEAVRGGLDGSKVPKMCEAAAALLVLEGIAVGKCPLEQALD